jgi:hypothetical protein
MKIRVGGGGFAGVWRGLDNFLSAGFGKTLGGFFAECTLRNAGYQQTFKI